MKIITVCVNNPLFIELQYKSIHRFFHSDEDVEFIVFNDAKDWEDTTNFNDPTMKKQIIDICDKLNIKYINIPNNHHKYSKNISLRHADSMNFVTKYIIENKDKYFMLDSDMFFVDEYNIHDLTPYYFAYVDQMRMIHHNEIHYPWPNFFYMDTTKAPNLEEINWNTDQGLDTGGKCALWLSKLEKEKTHMFQHLSSCNWNMNDLPKNINPTLLEFLQRDERNQNNLFFAELFDKKILHYRAASNWMNQTKSLHSDMTQLLYDTLIQCFLF